MKPPFGRAAQRDFYGPTLSAMGKIKVKFHEDRDDERHLVGIVAAPGEPGYPRAVQLKMAEEYGYSCDIDPAAK